MAKSSKVKAKPSKLSKVIAMPIASKKKKKSGRGSGPSDGDSIMTEDFENQFHKVMVFPPVSCIYTLLRSVKYSLSCGD